MVDTKRRALVWCIDSPGLGGSELDFMRLVERGVPQPDLVVCGPEVAPELRAFLERRGIPTRAGTQRNAAPHALSGLVHAGRLLRSTRGAGFVIWGHHVDSSRWIQLALALCGRRFLLAERFLPSSGSVFARSRLSVPIKRLVIRRAHAVVLNGHAQPGHYARLFAAKGRIAVIPNSRDTARIDEEVRRHRATPPAELRRSLGLPDDRIVLCVARLAPEKGLGDLIRGFARIPAAQGERARLVLVGDGPELEALRSLAAAVAPGAVTFAGKQEDPIRWIAAADVFVLPSLSEGLSGALVEAMAGGLPCVATDIPGNRELVVHEETGLLAPASAPAQLGDAIATLLRDRALAARLAEAGQRHVRERYDERTEVELWKTAIEELRSRS